MNKVRGYLTRRANGLYLVTAFHPILTEVVGAGHTDAYFEYGDPMAFINITPKFVDSMGVVPIETRVDPHRICFNGGLTPPTHILRHHKEFDLYKLTSIYDRCFIDYVCPWFIDRMFSITHIDKPQSIHFSGEIYGKARKKS